MSDASDASEASDPPDPSELSEPSEPSEADSSNMGGRRWGGCREGAGDRELEQCRGCDDAACSEPVLLS